MPYLALHVEIYQLKEIWGEPPALKRSSRFCASCYLAKKSAGDQRGKVTANRTRDISTTDDDAEFYVTFVCSGRWIC